MDPAECFVPTFLVRGGTAEEPQNFTWLYRQRNVATRLNNNLPTLAHVNSCTVNLNLQVIRNRKVERKQNNSSNATKSAKNANSQDGDDFITS